MSIPQAFADLPDPRSGPAQLHSMEAILVLVLSGFLCGFETWVELEGWAEVREEWFRTFLELPNGIPSHDTFGRVFRMLDPEAFSRSFSKWVASLAEVTEGEVVAIDGKTLRDPSYPGDRQMSPRYELPQQVNGGLTTTSAMMRRCLNQDASWMALRIRRGSRCNTPRFKRLTHPFCATDPRRQRGHKAHIGRPGRTARLVSR